jgi:alginate O-acetyltransferase complex protein AlgI
MLYVSLYHQLVAGPIVRYADIINEIDHRKFDIFDISKGVFRFCIGLFKKVVIANVAGGFVVKYLDGTLVDLTTVEAWFGICMFTIQIFFDFSAYSDMAIGLGQMFGFHYHENFNYPYISKSVTEFWRRWHISLSSWLNEYLFIPLSFIFRKLHKMGTTLALLITFFLSGLWHGASWNFVLWGVYFGVIIALEQFFLLKLFSKLPRFFSHIYLLFVIIISMCLFYFTDSNRLFTFVPMLFSSTNGLFNQQILQTLSENCLWLVLAIALCCPIFLRGKDLLKRFNSHYNSNMLWMAMSLASILLLFVSTIMLVGNSYNPFIYYRF